MRLYLWNQGPAPVLAALPVVLAIAIPATHESDRLLGLPGFVLFVLNLNEVVLCARIGTRLKGCTPRESGETEEQGAHVH